MKNKEQEKYKKIIKENYQMKSKDENNNKNKIDRKQKLWGPNFFLFL